MLKHEQLQQRVPEVNHLRILSQFRRDVQPHSLTGNAWKAEFMFTLNLTTPGIQESF